MDIKPLLLFPVKKSSITHYILAKSGFSGYNILSLFLAVPFSIVLITEEYPVLNVLGWLFAIICIVLTINYTNFIINKSDKVLMIIGALILALYGLDIPRYPNYGICRKNILYFISKPNIGIDSFGIGFCNLLYQL